MLRSFNRCSPWLFVLVLSEAVLSETVLVLDGCLNCGDAQGHCPVSVEDGQAGSLSHVRAVRPRGLKSSAGKRTKSPRIELLIMAIINVAN